MKPSDWIALGALAVAAFAVGLGEYRASQARSARSERNIVDWEVNWVRRDALELRNGGPDEARRVLIKLTSEYITVEAEAGKMRRGDVIELPVPHLAERWDATDFSPIQRGEFRHPGAAQYGARITWTSPKGNPQVEVLNSIVVTPVPRAPDNPLT